MSGTPPRPVTHFASDHIYALSFSRDGKRLALTRGNEKQDAVILSNFRVKLSQCKRSLAINLRRMA